MLSEWGFDFETEIGPHALILRPICKIFAGKVASCSSSLTLKTAFCFDCQFLFYCKFCVSMLSLWDFADTQKSTVNSLPTVL